MTLAEHQPTDHTDGREPSAVEGIATRGCPVTDFNYFGGERPVMTYLTAFDELRKQGPVIRSSVGPGFWIVTDMEAIRSAYQQPKVFSNSATVPLEPDPGYRWIPEMLDAPEHTTWRHLLSPIFSPARVAAMEAKIRSRATELIDPLVASGACDFVADFAMRFPPSIFMELLGLPVSEADRFMAWEDRILHGDDADVERKDVMAAMAEVTEYFAALIEERRANPKDDLVSAAIGFQVDGRPASDEDLLSLCLLLFMAGLDTVTAQLGYSWYHLATHPDVRARLATDPALIPDAIEEFVRFYTIVQPGRKVMSDTVIHGETLKAGDMVCLPLSCANRDQREFERAGEVIIDRKPNHHIGFGAGPHRCLGSHLARMELRIAVEEWHTRIPEYRIADGQAIEEHGGLFGLVALPLVWS